MTLAQCQRYATNDSNWWRVWISVTDDTDNVDNTGRITVTGRVPGTESAAAYGWHLHSVDDTRRMTVNWQRVRIGVSDCSRTTLTQLRRHATDDSIWQRVWISVGLSVRNREVLLGWSLIISRGEPTTPPLRGNILSSMRWDMPKSTSLENLSF